MAGAHDDGEAVHGEGLAALFGREGIGEDGLLGGGEAAAADALQDAAEDEQRQRRGDAAERGADAEERDADHVELLAPDEGGHVGAGRKDDGVGDEVGGEDPGGFVLRGAEAAGDVRQGDVGDGGVEHLHEGGERDRHGDDPRIDARTPRLLDRWVRLVGGRVRKLRAGEFECRGRHALSGLDCGGRAGIQSFLGKEAHSLEWFKSQLMNERLGR